MGDRRPSRSLWIRQETGLHVEITGVPPGDGLVGEREGGQGRLATCGWLVWFARSGSVGAATSVASAPPDGEEGAKEGREGAPNREEEARGALLSVASSSAYGSSSLIPPRQSSLTVRRFETLPAQ